MLRDQGYFTDANSYDLAFHVDKKWHKKRLYAVQSRAKVVFSKRSMSAHTDLAHLSGFACHRYISSEGMSSGADIKSR